MVEIVSAEGALRVPITYAPLLRNALSFWYRWTPAEDKLIPDRDNPGEFKTISVRSKQPKVEKVDLFSEDETWLWTHTGLYHKIEKTLNDAGHEVTCTRVGKPFASPVPTPFVIEGLYAEQVACVRRLLSTFSGGMAENATGSGKTRIIAALCRAYPNSNILVVTRKRPVVRHLHDELNKLVGSPVGIYEAGKKRRSQRINVCTSSMMAASVPRDWPDVILFDECHGAAGDQTAEALNEFVGVVKYGVSGTITQRWDGKDTLLESLFGPIVFRFSEKQATAMSRVVPIDVYVVRNKTGPRVSSTNPTTQERHGITENRTRNSYIREVVEFIPDDKQLIVFVRTLEHGQHLQAQYLPGFEMFHGELEPAVYTEILGRIVSGEAKRIIATNTIGEGVDPKNLWWIIDADWSSSRVSCMQRAGRNRRFAPGKVRGPVVAFSDEWDNRFAAKAKTRLKHYSFAGYDIRSVNEVREIFQHVNLVQ